MLEMHCLFFVFASFLLSEVSAEAEPIERIIKDYFNSASVRRFRKQWETHRKPLENAILTALKETVGLPGMNVYIKKMKEKLAAGYFHSDNQVQVIFSDLDLEDEPRCWLPEVQLSLASNVLKIQTTLSKMIIHADYTLIRNKSDIIYEPKDQDPFKSSPFLFEQVHDFGKVAITMEGCKLSGFIMTMLNGESVNLGYDHFKFYNCVYTIEIYKPGEDSPPVIAKYNLHKKENQGLSLTHLLMKPLLSEELVPKLRAAMFSFINTSAIFGSALREYRENQEIVFQASTQHFTELIRNLNKATVEKNNGAIEMEDHVMQWDNGRVLAINKDQNSVGESLELMDMVLTGLDTMYSAHCGGPFKIGTIMVADEIRFSSLQVRGKLEVKSVWSDTFSFAAEISDMVVDLQLGQAPDEKKRKQAKSNPGFKKFEVTGFRRMTFTVPTLLFSSVESLLHGYLMNEVPKLLMSHLWAIFSDAIQKNTKVKLPPIAEERDSAYSEIIEEDNNDSDQADPKSESNPLTDSEDREYQDLKGKRARDLFKKSKKRFKSAYRPRLVRRYGSRKRVADNQIRRK